jgi:hypothetical protein
LLLRAKYLLIRTAQIAATWRWPSRLVATAAEIELSSLASRGEKKLRAKAAQGLCPFAAVVAARAAQKFRNALKDFGKWCLPDGGGRAGDGSRYSEPAQKSAIPLIENARNPVLSTSSKFKERLLHSKKDVFKHRLFATEHRGSL